MRKKLKSLKGFFCSYFLDVPLSFAITKLTTYNMNSTVYWKPAKFLGNKSIEYYVEFNDGVNNHSLLCTSPRWHQKSGDLSCLFLTCNSTILDVSYEVRVKAGNSSAVTPVMLYNPTEESTFVVFYTGNVQTAKRALSLIYHEI